MDDETILNIIQTSISDNARRIESLLKKKDLMEKKVLKFIKEGGYGIMLAHTQFAILKGVNELIVNAQKRDEAFKEELKNHLDRMKRHR